MTDAVILVVEPSQLLATSPESIAILNRPVEVVVENGAQIQHQLRHRQVQAQCRLRAPAPLQGRFQAILCCTAQQLQT
jgi:hypothetical protein